MLPLRRLLQSTVQNAGTALLSKHFSKATIRYEFVNVCLKPAIWNPYNRQIVEKAYQKTKNFDRLSFLYLATGSSDKLTKMQKIAQSRGDPMSRFHNALYAGDVESRISVLRDVGMCKSCSVFYPFTELYMSIQTLLHISRRKQTIFLKLPRKF